MKGFNRKRIISSLAASAMVAAATLAPLPGLLAPVHAAAGDFVQINNPAHIDANGASGLNGIDVTLTYLCNTGTNTTGQIVASVTQTPSQTGDGATIAPLTAGPVVASNVANPVQIKCDSVTHQVTATLYPPTSAAFFNVGQATVTATLTDAAGAPVTPATTTIVRVV